MKVLFAVSNEEISESIVKKYQKQYKQIISYKNVYYFNAILKEIQKDKSYDRIVISEELEAFTHTQYDQIDKFIFEKLDGISDEASNSRGNDIPIILICSDRRVKSEEMLVKLFGIGIYNAIIGTDRSVEEVCRLINRPRTKKEAKTYYQIESENVSYQSESENDVSEVEIQNILAHYKRLGKNEDRYLESFDNIAAQYNDTQLRIITKFLPLNVRAVLEERSPKYQQIMSFNSKVSDKLRTPKEEIVDGTSEKLLKPKTKERIMTGPVVIPSAVDMSGGKKLTRVKPIVKPVEQPAEEIEKPEYAVMPGLENIDEEEPINTMTEIESQSPEPIVEAAPVKRGRGRPRKNPVATDEKVAPVKRGRGRPRKNPEPVAAEKIAPQLPLDKEETPMQDIIENETPMYQQKEEEETILPGIDESVSSISAYEKDYSSNLQSANSYIPNGVLPGLSLDNKNIEVETIDLSSLLSSNKKIVSFVGTSKNGTSFIVNNLAEMLSTSGIDVAILDTTQNRNSYYIYTKNEEELRETSAQCMKKLVDGSAQGIRVHSNLTVYTALPEDNEFIVHADKILETLLKKHTLILIDTDFKTPNRCFEQSKEIYLVQTLDVLTIQPLTAFLRELKAKNILDEKKLRIVLNKAVKIRGVNDKTIIGGMAFYNDPSMSFMTELFDRTMIKYTSIPFEEETYIKYLENVIECNVSLKGYSKIFLQRLKDLANMVYSNNSTYTPPSAKNYGSQSTFSPGMAQTLDQMKKSY